MENEIKKHEDKLKSLKEQIKKEEELLLDMQERTRKAIEKCTDTELNEIPERYLNRILRKASSNFAPGDKVWAVMRDETKTPCPRCKGVGKLVARLDDGEPIEVECPTCYCGRVWHYSYDFKKYTIEEITLKLEYDEKKDFVFRWRPIGLVELTDINGQSESTGIDGICFTKEEAEHTAKLLREAEIERREEFKIDFSRR